MTNHWNFLSKYLFVPHSEEDYHKLVLILDELLNEVEDNEEHPLASLTDVIGTLIEDYENIHVPEMGSTQKSKPSKTKNLIS